MKHMAPGDAAGSDGGCPFRKASRSLSASGHSPAHAASPFLPVPWLSFLWSTTSDFLSPLDPLLLVLLSACLTLLLRKLLLSLSAGLSAVREKGLAPSLQSFLFFLLKKLPGVAEKIHAEQHKMVAKVQASLLHGRDTWRRQLPSQGLQGEQVQDSLEKLRSLDKAWKGKCSGTVYMGGPTYEEHVKLITHAYCKFSHTNPLHSDVFMSVVRMEAEVVGMTAGLLRGGYGEEEQGNGHRGGFSASLDGQGDEVCGNMTSGGTESILMAVKAARDFMREHNGITQPEMIIPVSGHSAYDKAAQYFGIRLKRAAVGPDLRVDIKAVRALLSPNTILIVGSAPGFPHGVIDPIEKLGRIAVRRGICFHVDCCLGGFVLPFARKLGYSIPPFDFGVPGVTSISVDVHKYGLAPKGTSVVLFRNHKLRRHQYVAVTEWSGGLYVSPSVAGSRSGGLIAGAWAALLAVGESGYLHATAKLMDASAALRRGIEEIGGLRVLGKPDMTVVAFATEDRPEDVYRVNDAMTERGWSLNALQKPASVHMCVTLQHVDVIDSFLTDLRDCTQQVLEDPGAYQSGMAPVYGAAAAIPDRVAVGEFLVELMESSF